MIAKATTISEYNESLSGDDREICELLFRWLEKSKSIQWDYKNIVKHRGVLEKIG